MKKTILFIVFALILAVSNSTDVYAIQSEDVSQKVVVALREGNAREAARYFGTTVDLKVPGNEGTFSRNQAELILRNFFSSHPPASFSLQHQGQSRDGSPYVIGNYRSQKGENFRTYFLMKSISGKMVLHLLQFDPQ